MLASMFTLEILSSRQESQTNDEGIHLAAGLSYWRTGDFRINPEHPPLVKMLAAVPLLFTRATVPINDPSWQQVDEWVFGDRFLYSNTLSPQTLLFLGRLPIMILSLVLGWLIWRTATRFFGSAGGLVALGLYAFDPNIIAHSRYVTTDLAFGLMALVMVLCFERWWRQPSRDRAIVFGIVLWVSMLTKFSFFPWAVGLGGLWLLLKWRDPSHPVVQWRALRRFALWFIGLGAIMTWALYNFDVHRPIDDPRITLLYQQRQNVLDRGVLNNYGPLERWVVGDLGNRSKPLGHFVFQLTLHRYPGYEFFRGVMTVIGHSDAGQASFLLGKRSDLGWWYYFPVAIATKSPPATLLGWLVVVSAGMVVITRARRASRTFTAWLQNIDVRWLMYGVPPLVFFLISLGSHLNLGWRYILAIYPFMFILAGGFAPWLLRTSKRWGNIFLVAWVILAIGTQLRTFPNELAYFNGFSGGSQHGYKILNDSNFDWGQSLYQLGQYLRQQEATTVAVDYYGRGDITKYLPQPTTLPTTQQLATRGLPHGYVAVSIVDAEDGSGRFDWLKAYQAQIIIGTTIRVYRLP